MSKPDIIPTQLETVIDQLTAWYAHSVLTNGPDSPGLAAAVEAMNTPMLAPRPTQAFLFPLEKEGTA